MKIYKKCNNQIAQQLAEQYDIKTLQEALQVAKTKSNNPYGFYVGQKLTYSKKSGYRGTCVIENINDDGTLKVLDQSGRYMPNFKPVQMGMNMFEEM